jgi:hypothetical protein
VAKLGELAWSAIPWMERQLDRALKIARALPLLAYSAPVSDLASSWYYRGRGLRPDEPKRELFPFEIRALERFFPKPPASLFIPGCGTGREALALLERGYEIEAVEPEASSAARARQVLPAEVAVHAERVQDWARRTTSRRFDAIVTGWGMWSYIVEPAERRELLSVFRKASDGPVLVSFWRAEAAYVAGKGSGAVQNGGRIDRAVERLRATIGKPLPPHLIYYSGLFGHLVSEESLAEEAGQVGYEIGHYEHDGSVFPNAVLVPKQR